MADGLMGLVEEKPWLVGGLVLVVIVLAYMQSRSAPAANGAVTFAGGGAARAIDPEAAAISEAAISAGQANLNTIASLVGLENSNESALTGSLAQTSAERDAALAGTTASRDVSLAGISSQTTLGLAQTSAQRDAALAATAAGQETADHSTDANLTLGIRNATSADYATTINGQTAAAQIAANAAATKQAADVANFQTQAQKDIARASDNTNIVDSVISGAVHFFSSFF